jgi:aquaporin Z
MMAALVTEVVLTLMFLLVILGATDELAPIGFAGLAKSLCLTSIHLISIPVTNTPVNPARRTGRAVFVGGQAVTQLWLFWLATIIVAILAGLVCKFFWLAKPNYFNVLQKRFNLGLNGFFGLKS